MGAANFCHPLDVLRVQLQIDSEGGKTRQYSGTLDAAKKIAARNGVRRGLYAGLSAAYLRQWTYGSCRIGIFSWLLSANKPKDGSPVPFSKKVAYGMFAGAIGSFVGTPSELALVRMSADSKLPEAEKRNYKGIFDVIRRVVTEEGFTSLWKGAGITVARACVMGACVNGCTSQAKEIMYDPDGLFSDKGSVALMFWATNVASVAAVATTQPLDVVKSRLQQMPTVEAGMAPLYTGILDCGKKSVAKEGVAVLWSGSFPSFIKLAPYTTISMMLVNKMIIALTGQSAF